MKINVNDEDNNDEDDDDDDGEEEEKGVVDVRLIQRLIENKRLLFLIN